MTDSPGSDTTTSPEARREMLRRLLERRLAAESAEQPLSAQQERLWVAHHLDPDDPSQNLRTGLHVRGRLDQTALEAALRAVVARHEQLSATFHEVDGRPIARIAPSVDVSLETHDATTGADVDTELLRFAGRPFDLTRAPLVRLGLWTASNDEHTAALVVHHIVCDAWSMDLLLRELLETYGALVDGRRPETSPAPSHRDYAVAQAEALEGAEGRRQVAFWSDQLSGLETGLLLPYGDTPSGGQQMSSRRLPFIMPPPLGRRLDELARSQGATLYMVLLTGVAALLHRLGAGDEVVLATPVANRQEEDWEAIVGYFVNLLPIRIDVATDATFRETLLQTRRRVLDAHDHQMLPVHRIAEAAGLRPATLVRGLYQHVAAPTRGIDVAATELAVEPHPIDLGRTRHELALTTWLDGDGVAGILEYASDLIDAESAARLISDLERVLGSILDQPDARLGALPLSPEWPTASPSGGSSTTSGSPAAATAQSEPDRSMTPARESPTQERPTEGTTAGELTAIWSAVLETDDISPFDNFLDIGGDSLLALQVIERTEASLGVRIAPADLFTQTLTQLAASIEARRG